MRGFLLHQTWQHCSLPREEYLANVKEIWSAELDWLWGTTYTRDWEKWQLMMVQFFTEVQAKLQGVSPSEAMGPLRSLRLTVIFLQDSSRHLPATPVPAHFQYDGLFR